MTITMAPEALRPYAHHNSLFLPHVGLLYSLSTCSSPQLPPIRAPTGQLGDSSTKVLRLLSTSYPQYFGSPALLPLLYSVDQALATTNRSVFVPQ